MSHGVLERVSIVLETMRESSRPLTLADVTRRSGIPRSSVHRILERLIELGWLSRRNGGYILSLQLYELGIGAAQSNQLMRVCWPVLQELYKDTGHAALLGTLRGNEVMLLQKSGGRHAAVIPFRVGSRLPATKASIGKVLLGTTPSTHLGDEPAANLAENNPRLQHELDQARETGIAFNRDELVSGLSCIGAAVRVYGYPSGVAIAICGPSARLQDRSLNRAVQAMAATVGRSMEALEMAQSPGHGRQPSPERQLLLNSCPPRPHSLIP